MKKILVMLATIAVALTACDSGKSFKLDAQGLPVELNGEYAFIVDEEDNVVVDSIAISNGTFKYEKKEPLPTGLHGVVIGESFTSFYFEAGAFTLEKKDSVPGKMYQFNGPETSMTMGIQKFNEEISIAIQPYRELLNKIQSTIDRQYTEEQVAEATKAYEEMYTIASTIGRNYYEQYKEQAIAPFFFAQIRFEKDEDFIKEYEAASDFVKSDSGIKDRYETLMKEAATGPGKEYVDYELNDGAGNTKKISDFRTEGNYLLLDFFASWCGPCKRSMPHLAQLHKTLGEKGLNVTSIAIWERGETPREDYLNAVKEWGITWNHFFDSESKAAEVYAISGVPTMFLISPEGTILVRTHNPEDIDNKLKELGLL